MIDRFAPCVRTRPRTAYTNALAVPPAHTLDVPNKYTSCVRRRFIQSKLGPRLFGISRVCFTLTGSISNLRRETRRKEECCTVLTWTGFCGAFLTRMLITCMYCSRPKVINGLLISDTLPDSFTGFNEFIHEREAKPQNHPTIMLFDQIILSKRNRGRTSFFNKSNTNFLSNTSDHLWRSAAATPPKGRIPGDYRAVITRSLSS